MNSDLVQCPIPGQGHNGLLPELPPELRDPPDPLDREPPSDPEDPEPSELELEPPDP